MKKKKFLLSLLLVCSVFVGCAFPAFAAEIADDDSMNMFEHSDFIEKEQPELDEETKRLISLYQRNPSEENYNNLREAVMRNYDAVLVRKEAKLAELKAETAGKPGGDAKVAEMQEIVDEMYRTYQDRIASTMLRFTDARLLKWKIGDAPMYEYIPVMGAGENVYVGRTQVTNAEYAYFLAETGYAAPVNWKDGRYPEGEENYPVNFVSAEDAAAYCRFLTAKDETDLYRLPTESEWELAAGNMPKDADFNCGVNNGRTPVEQYATVTRGAHGAVDFWGNVWEWTTTLRREENDACLLGVKGGAWNSARTDCRTEYREEARVANLGYEDVGFRVIRVSDGKGAETEKFSPADFDVTIARECTSVGTRLIVKITASLEVATVYVNEARAQIIRVSEKKENVVWKVVLIPDTDGVMEIKTVAYSTADAASDPIMKNIVVSPRKGKNNPNFAYYLQ